MDGWLKEVAPSNALRRWFNHDPAKWKDFSVTALNYLTPPKTGSHCLKQLKMEMLRFCSARTISNTTTP